MKHPFKKALALFTLFLLSLNLYSQEAAQKNAALPPSANPDAQKAAQPAAMPQIPGGVIVDIEFIGLKRTSKKYLMGMFGRLVGCPIAYFNKQQILGGLMAIGLFYEADAELVRIGDAPPAAAAPPQDGSATSDNNATTSDNNAAPPSDSSANPTDAQLAAAQNAPSPNQPPLDNRNAILRVTVKEKWSILGSFYGYGDDAGFVGGVAFMDMNVFGCNRMFVGLGTFGADVQRGDLMFIDPPQSYKRPGYIIHTNISNDTPTYSDYEENELEEFHLFRVGTGITMMILTKPFMINAGFKYDYTGFFYDDIHDMHVDTLSLSISKGWPKKNEWFTLPRTITVGGSVSFDFGRWVMPMGEIKWGGSFAVASPKYPRMNFRFDIAGVTEFDKPLTMLANRGSVTSLVSPNNFVSDSMASARFTWETGLFKTKYVTMAFFASYEGFISRDIDVDDTSDGHLDINTTDSLVWGMGPGAGLKFYFHSISIPAMLMGVFYNTNTNKWQFGFSVGM